MAHIAKYKLGALGNMCGHYNRWKDVPEGMPKKERQNIDPSLSHLNYNLAPERERGQVAFIDSRIKSLELKRTPRKDAVRMCDCVVTMPKSLDPALRDEFFAAAYGELAAKFGDENIISAYVHLDEPKAMPHMHFAWVPVTKDGRLSGKEVVNRNVLKRLHTDLQVELERALGCFVEVILSPEKEQEKALSHVPQKYLDTAREELEALETQKEALTAEIAAETVRLERLRLGADAMESIVAEVREYEAAPRHRKSEVLNRITAKCNGYVNEIRGRINQVRERIQQVAHQAKQRFSLENRACEARKASREIPYQSHSYGRDVRLDR